MATSILLFVSFTAFFCVNFSILVDEDSGISYLHVANIFSGEYRYVFVNKMPSFKRFSRTEDYFSAVSTMFGRQINFLVV
jgi:hypothetical protein